MKRRVLLLVLLLMGGAIVNIVVAWGLCIVAYRHDPNGTSRRPNGDEIAWWNSAAMPMGPDELSRVRSRTSLGFSEKRYTGFSAAVTLSDGRPVQYAARGTWFEAGFPARAMRAASFTYHDAPTDSWRDEAREALHLSASPQSIFPKGLEYLPRGPIWPGFAINTMFYAAILWLLCGGPFALRRRRRIKRGLCVKCAYPRGANEVCTECGAALFNACPLAQDALRVRDQAACQ